MIFVANINLSRVLVDIMMTRMVWESFSRVKILWDHENPWAKFFSVALISKIAIILVLSIKIGFFFFWYCHFFYSLLNINRQLGCVQQQFSAAHGSAKRALHGDECCLWLNLLGILYQVFSNLITKYVIDITQVWSRRPQTLFTARF